MSFGGGSSGGTTTSQVTPYAPAEPALAQILSEAGQLYNQGVGASGYVAPTQQTLQGLAAQEQEVQTHPTPVSYTHLTLPTIYSV